MRVYKPSDLLKAKYLKRWRGPGGKWQYEYAKPKSPKKATVFNPTDMKDMTAGEKMKHAAAVMTGRNLPEATYGEVPVPSKMKAAERSKLNRALNEALPGNYYESIPMEEVQSALQKEGYVLIQEDGTKWSGMLMGDDSNTIFEIGKLSEGRMVNGLATYKPVPNAGLFMSWYRMPSGKVEIVKYVG